MNHCRTPQLLPCPEFRQIIPVPLFYVQAIDMGDLGHFFVEHGVFYKVRSLW